MRRRARAACGKGRKGGREGNMRKSGHKSNIHTVKRTENTKCTCIKKGKEGKGMCV